MGEESECAFGTYSRSLDKDLLFKRFDLPGENSPNFNPYEPDEIGGRWTQLIVYKADEVDNNNSNGNNSNGNNSNSNNSNSNNSNNDPTSVNAHERRSVGKPNNPGRGGRRYTKSSRKSKCTRRNKRKH